MVLVVTLISPFPKFLYERKNDFVPIIYLYLLFYLSLHASHTNTTEIKKTYLQRTSFSFVPLSPSTFVRFP